MTEWYKVGIYIDDEDVEFSERYYEYASPFSYEGGMILRPSKRYTALAIL